MDPGNELAENLKAKKIIPPFCGGFCCCQCFKTRSLKPSVTLGNKTETNSCNDHGQRSSAPEVVPIKFRGHQSVRTVFF